MSDVLDWDRWEAELGPRPAPKRTEPEITMGADGMPLDPAQTRAYDRQQQFLLNEQAERLLELEGRRIEVRQADRRDIEDHWGRYLQVLDYEAQVRSIRQAPQPQVQVWQPAQWQPMPTQTWWEVNPEKLRRENRAIAVSLAFMAVLCVLTTIVLAAAFYGQGVHAAQRHTPAAQVAP